MACCGTRVRSRSTPSKRRVYSRTAALPRTRTSSVTGFTRVTAWSTSRAARGSRPSRAARVRPGDPKNAASRPRRSIRVVTGLAPLSEVTCLVYERCRPGAELSACWTLHSGGRSAFCPVTAGLFTPGCSRPGWPSACYPPAALGVALGCPPSVLATLALALLLALLLALGVDVPLVALTLAPAVRVGVGVGTACAVAVVVGGAVGDGDGIVVGTAVAEGPARGCCARDRATDWAPAGSGPGRPG